MRSLARSPSWWQNKKREPRMQYCTHNAPNEREWRAPRTERRPERVGLFRESHHRPRSIFPWLWSLAKFGRGGRIFSHLSQQLSENIQMTPRRLGDARWIPAGEWVTRTYAQTRARSPLILTSAHATWRILLLLLHCSLRRGCDVLISPREARVCGENDEYLFSTPHHTPKRFFYYYFIWCDIGINNFFL